MFIDYGVRFTAIISRHSLLDDEDLAWLANVPDAAGLSSEQRAILATMRRGHAWSNGMVREEFAPIESVDARRLLQHLVDQGLAVMTGARGNAIYELAPALGGAPAQGTVEVLARTL